MIPAEFASRPSVHAAPAAVASLLGCGITSGLVERMMAFPFLRTQLDAELSNKLGSLPAELTPVQAHVVSLNPNGLTHLALRAGAVWHSAAIAKVYDGAGVRSLVERIGPEFRSTALADIAAHPRLPATPTSEPPLDKLPAEIARDGVCCLVAWCEAQPRPVGWRILLRLRLNGRADPRHVEYGPAIIDRVAVQGTPA